MELLQQRPTKRQSQKPSEPKAKRPGHGMGMQNCFKSFICLSLFFLTACNSHYANHAPDSPLPSTSVPPTSTPAGASQPKPVVLSSPFVPTAVSPFETLKIKHFLKNLLVEKIVWAKGLNFEDFSSAHSVIEGMETCGFDYLGPHCYKMEIPHRPGNFQAIETQANEIHVAAFLEAPMTAPNGASFIYEFVVKRQANNPILYEVMSLRLMKTLESAGSYDPSHLTDVAAIEVSAQPLQKALQKLNSPADIRELTCMMQIVWELAGQPAGNSFFGEQMQKILLEHLELLAGDLSTGPAPFQLNMLKYLYVDAGESIARMVPLCEPLLDSKDERVSTVCAAVLLDYNPMRTELRAKVQELLSMNEIIEFSDLAIEALGQTP